MIEFLDGVKEINGHKIMVMDDLKQERPELFNESGAMDYKVFEAEIRPNYFIYLRKDKNTLTIKLQDGPIKENGHNGCQIDDALELIRTLLFNANKRLPCRENACAITRLDESIGWLERRKKDRKKRGVEGTSKV